MFWLVRFLILSVLLEALIGNKLCYAWFCDYLCCVDQDADTVDDLTVYKILLYRFIYENRRNRLEFIFQVHVHHGAIACYKAQYIYSFPKIVL